MKVGCIGLGDIAQKAYLPVLTTRPGIELHLQTRNPDTLERVGDTHHVPAARRRHRSRRAARRGARRGLRARRHRGPPRDRHTAAGGRRAHVRGQAARLRTRAFAAARGTGRAARGLPRRRLQPPLRTRLRAVRRPRPRADHHAEEPGRAARGPAHAGAGRLHPRRRHPAVPAARRGRPPRRPGGGARGADAPGGAPAVRSPASPPSAS